MSLKLISAPAVEPVSLAEAKLQCAIDSDTTAFDSFLTDICIPSARAAAEQECDCALITQTWERVIDAFPLAEIELGKAPVQSIVSVRYLDTTGAQQTLSSAAYLLDADQPSGWLLPAYGYTWPATIDSANAVRVQFKAGYGDTASSVPPGIKNWILLRIGTLFRYREQFQTGQMSEIPNAFSDRLLDPYRNWAV